MTRFAAVAEREFASALQAMTDDELFKLMADLEARGQAGRPADEVFAKIVLIESAIERRFPGQMLWKGRPHQFVMR
ncbi:hypothetical protein B5K08_26980 [Rhizobium leguminosarum bv. trifolii]|uniref:Uncharacterized protein n=1 Tax=Rhizobium leguminosarum bv. trifolii TaxID=386 RepID=A0A3E1B5Z0_RHILT|nr:hypothetical protein [Rhizobium leguminosarum]RFB85149.1 hypothetical protein B5K08_26980 [Rhizobium leguminosarum bv. trifolii]RFB86216.1 hypothetical protein B5K10_25695 [Rhizobium leguminosarum bv. trifolii]